MAGRNPASATRWLRVYRPPGVPVVVSCFGLRSISWVQPAPGGRSSTRPPDRSGAHRPRRRGHHHRRSGHQPRRRGRRRLGPSDTLNAAASPRYAGLPRPECSAVGLEGEAGGPLTDAARSFDRAGRDINRRIPTRTDTGTALRSAGRMIALLAPGTDHPGARVAAVTVALAALTAAVADLRQSRNRLHQAEAACASANQLRSVAAVPLPAEEVLRGRATRPTWLPCRSRASQARSGRIRPRLTHRGRSRTSLTPRKDVTPAKARVVRLHDRDVPVGRPMERRAADGWLAY